MWHFSDLKTGVWLLALSCILFACSTTEIDGYGYIPKPKIKKERAKEDMELSSWMNVHRPKQGEIRIATLIGGQGLLSIKKEAIKQVHFQLDWEVRKTNYGGEVFGSGTEIHLIDPDSTWRMEASITIPEDKDVYLEWTITDVNKNVYRTKGRFIYNSEEWMPEDMHCSNLLSPSPESFLHLKDSNLLVSGLWQDQVFSILHYNQIIPKARLPFKAPEKGFQPLQKADSLKLNLKELNEYKKENKGLFYIQPEDSESDSWFCFGSGAKDFPLDALEYLSNEPANSNPKDWGNFWMYACSGDSVLVQKFSEEYLRRIDYANVEFTCFKEGWKTDRGMIFLIFGAPNHIVEGPQGLEWHYNFSTPTSNYFLFSRNPLGMHPNDYRLNRSKSYYLLWEQATKKWLNGDISILY